MNSIDLPPYSCSSSFHPRNAVVLQAKYTTNTLHCRRSPAWSSRRISCSSDGESRVISSKNRPVVILPGLGNNTADYNELKASLMERGLSVTVAQVSRPDWLRNALGLLDRNYWSGTLSPRPVLDWYFERIKVAISTAKQQVEGDMKVSLVGHSAGGWLARVYMAEFGIDDIAVLVSLGTPHLPPPKGIPGVIDQTRGLLDYVNEVCPGSCFAPDVDYICVAGRFVKGERFFSEKRPAVAATGLGALVATNEGEIRSVSELSNSKNDNEKEKQNAISFQSRIVGQGYKQV
ncbi:hypothetical protein KP509_16G039500 [Ceratopteris richardii]|nr:hypothetical protein KP509_16G039500 [Ceratopteris richardii]